MLKLSMLQTDISATDKATQTTLAPVITSSSVTEKGLKLLAIVLDLICLLIYYNCKSKSI
jgi:GTPase